MKIYLLLAWGLFALSESVCAQVPPGGCASGLNVPGCLPPDDPRLGSGAQTAPPQPIWADRWGAIASDGNGTYGIVVDIESKRKAQKAAIQECKKRGGGACTLKRDYYNQCAAVVLTDTKSAYANAPTLEEAVEIGKQDCAASNTGDCRIYWSGCSTAVQVN